MKVILANKLGFCFGVKRALDITEAAIEKSVESHEEISMLGALIHNKAVVANLQERGIRTVDTIEETTCGKLVIRAHGATKEVLSNAREKNLDVIDATCPLVERAHKAAAQLVKEGYTVYLAGDKGHAEVAGIVSAAGGKVIVVATPEDIKQTEHRGKVGLLFQTTKDPRTAPGFYEALFKNSNEIRTINTICNATTERQIAIRELAPKVDCVIVVGDMNSANTARLTLIARELNPRTIQVENASELSKKFFQGCQTAGVSAGASTPDWLIEEVTKFITSL
jgi:4-hydroxy-3-methylbut-2-enyl diphosphate reductase